jgi:glutaredoxin 3
LFLPGEVAIKATFPIAITLFKSLGEFLMPTIRMYSTQTCPYCIKAEQFLHRKGVSVQKILIDRHPEELSKMVQLTGRRTVPQIFINERHVGGFDDLIELDQNGQLEPLLKAD